MTSGEIEDEQWGGTCICLGCYSCARPCPHGVVTLLRQMHRPRGGWGGIPTRCVRVARRKNREMDRFSKQCWNSFQLSGLSSRLMQILIWTYALGLLAWAMGRAVAGDRSILVLSLGYLGVWLFFPLPILGFWVLLKWRKTPGALLLIPAGLFLWFYGPLFLPHAAATSSPNEPVSVMTFNLQFTNTDREALVAKLMASQADILAMQEVAPSHQKHLDPVLGGRYSYHFYSAPSGLAVYSRYPILAAELLPMESSSAQSLVIQVNEASFHLINVHMARTGILQCLMTLDTNHLRDLVSARESQITQIQETIDKVGLPAIVACDCNMTDLMAAYDQLTTSLRDVHRERGWGLGHTFLIPRGFGFPSDVNLPVQRIDYIFHSPDIDATQSQVLSGEGGSDHLPVMAQFDLRP